MIPSEPTRIFSRNDNGSDHPASLVTDLDHFDVNEFMIRTYGSVQLCQELVTLFIQNGPEYIAEIQNALAAHDAGDLYRSAHKLKGAAKTMALPRLAETARAIESAVHSEDMESAGALLPELLDRFAHASKALQDVFTLHPHATLPQEKV